ncbi:hypothetical protein LguiA_008595 [Lonicera macranthoides]
MAGMFFYEIDLDWNRAGEVVVAKAIERCVRRLIEECKARRRAAELSGAVRQSVPEGGGDSSVDVRSLNKPPEQGYSNKSSSIGRTPGYGRFTVFRIILGAIFSADDRNLKELPKGANERDG